MNMYFISLFEEPMFLQYHSMLLRSASFQWIVFVFNTEEAGLATDTDVAEEGIVTHHHSFYIHSTPEPLCSKSPQITPFIY